MLDLRCHKLTVQRRIGSGPDHNRPIHHHHLRPHTYPTIHNKLHLLHLPKHEPTPPVWYCDIQPRFSDRSLYSGRSRQKYTQPCLEGTVWLRAQRSFIQLYRLQMHYEIGRVEEMFTIHSEEVGKRNSGRCCHQDQIMYAILQRV